MDYNNLNCKIMTRVFLFISIIRMAHCNFTVHLYYASVSLDLGVKKINKTKNNRVKKLFELRKNSKKWKKIIKNCERGN